METCFFSNDPSNQQLPDTVLLALPSLLSIEFYVKIYVIYHKFSNCLPGNCQPIRSHVRKFLSHLRLHLLDFLMVVIWKVNVHRVKVTWICVLLVGWKKAKKGDISYNEIYILIVSYLIILYVWILKSHCSDMNSLWPSDTTDLGQHWLRKWLIAWWPQAITWANINLQSKVFWGIQLKVISQGELMNLICNMCLGITILKHDIQRMTAPSAGRDQKMRTLAEHVHFK